MNQLTRLTLLGLYTIGMDLIATNNPEHKYFVLLFGVYAYEYITVFTNKRNIVNE